MKNHFAEFSRVLAQIEPNERSQNSLKNVILRSNCAAGINLDSEIAASTIADVRFEFGLFVLTHGSDARQKELLLDAERLLAEMNNELANQANVGRQI